MTATRKISALLFIFFFSLMFSVLVLHCPFNIFPTPSVTAISTTKIIAKDSLTPPTIENKNWKTQILPDDWRQSEKKQTMYWYKSHVNITSPAKGEWAIYLPMVAHNARVFINDVWIGQGGKFNNTVARNHNQPLLFEFSASLLNNGINTIDIGILSTSPQQGFLDNFYMAPTEQLYLSWKWKTFIRVDIIRWVTWFMFFTIPVLLLFWLARPQDTIYGIFSLEIFFWAAHNLNLFITNIPIPTLYWEAMTMATLGWSVTAMVFFNHRYTGNINRSVELLLVFTSVLGIGFFFFPNIEFIHHIGYKFLDSFLVLVGAYALYHLVISYWKQANLDIFLMMLVGSMTLTLGLHDILLVNNLRDRREGLLIQYAVFPTLSLFYWFLLKRFISSINKAEELAETLEKRVLDREKQLKVQYEQLKILAQQKLITDERERIMQDVHDGIGGQMIALISELQNYSGDIFRNLEKKAKNSLIDLRLVIDSLDPTLEDIPTLLGMMRFRLSDQLTAANIDLDWQITELPTPQAMTPKNCLHIMRIIQEAITNAIKHSGTQTITVATGIIDNDNKIYIDIIDYGKNPIDKNQSTGRGLENLKHRTKQIAGADIDIHLSNQGSRLRLMLS